MADIFTGLATTAVLDFSPTVTQVDSIEPGTFEDDGGYEFFLIGLFKEEPAQVLIIVDGNEIECYSGARGERNRPNPLAGNILRAVTPPLPIGGPYPVKVVQGLTEDTLFNAITVVARNWRSKVHELRRLWPPHYRTGRRNLNNTDLLHSALTVGFIPDQVAQVGVAFSLQPQTFNPLGAALTWTNVGTALPGWAMLDANTGEISGTPTPGDEGTFPGFQLEVTDGTTTVQTSVFELDVQVVPLTVEDIPTPQNATQGVPFSFIPTINNVSGFPLTVTSIGTALPAWVTLTSATGELSGTPGAPDVGTTVGHQLEITDGFSTIQTTLFDLTVT